MSPSHPSPAVQLDGVTKRFGASTAVNDLWLKVESGEFLTLLGPSGCGKSTLLNLIAGFLTADSGEIFIRGECVTRVRPAQRSIGMVFQNYALFPHMSVAQNVAFGLKMRHVSQADIRRRVAEALDIVQLAPLADRRPKQLSGGQQQRVALARALVIDPTVLLLDEPLSALDKNLRASMQVELKEIQRRVGITTIFVTHDQSEALSLSDRIAVMSNGVIQQLSAPRELYRQPANDFVASFVGEVNRLPGRIARREGGEVLIELANGRSLILPAARAGERAAGAPVSVYIRPERTYLGGSGKGAVIAVGPLQAHVYQGTHVELYVACPDCGSIKVRAAEGQGEAGWMLGAATEVEADISDATVFDR